MGDDGADGGSGRWSDEMLGVAGKCPGRWSKVVEEERGYAAGGV